jgi:sugar phosphate isomerase/epimerase
MDLGIFAETFPRPTLGETLDAVVAQKLTHVQFNMSCLGLATLPDRLDESSCVWIAQSFRERGLSMAAVSGTFNMCDPSSSRIEHNLRRLDLLADACRWLDTRLITLCTGTDDSGDMWKWHRGNASKAVWERLVETMQAAAKIADRHEVTLAFEPDIHNVASSVMRARRLLDEVGSPWLKVLIDPANLIHAGDRGQVNEILLEASEWLGPEIVLAHANHAQSLQQSSELSPGRPEVYRQWGLFPVDIPFAKEFWEKIAAEAGLSDAEYEYASRWMPYYYPYLAALKKCGFRGPVIMHGLEEKDVPAAASVLRLLLG